jgi:hypothetical protein
MHRATDPGGVGSVRSHLLASSCWSGHQEILELRLKLARVVVRVSTQGAAGAWIGRADLSTRVPLAQEAVD